MVTNYLQYNFDTNTATYPSGYDSTKLNLGWLMYRKTDENGELYISPLEPKFLRCYEVLSVSPYSYAVQIDSLGSVKYNDDTIWLFYCGGGSQGTTPKRIFLATFKKSISQFTDIGSILINFPDNTNHQCYTILPSLERHTGGTITVSGNSVTGLGTTWLTDGVCVGNRIGFGSTNSDDITIWYRVNSVNSNTSITIIKEFYNDGNPSTLNITGATSYVIEDFRLIYINYAGGSATIRGISLVKGLRYELFLTPPTSIPAATTIDNIRACYRILDSATTSATFAPFGGVLMDKTSLTNQDLYTITTIGGTSISIQKFNIRSSLTLTAGRSNTPYQLTTGSQVHNGSSILGYIPMITDFNNNFYITPNNRISRIPISGITASSTTFIVDSMVENPPGTLNTYPLSSQLYGGQYLRQAQRFYISHAQGTIRNYVTQYTPGGLFDRPIHINDQTQQGTYLVDKFDNLTTNFLSLSTYTHYSDGILFLVRGSSTNTNIIYSLPIEADEDFHTISNCCVITPELSTLSATSYNKVYVDVDTFFNKDQRFYIPRETWDIYYRTNGISTDTGSWTLVPPSGQISGNSNSIQFKLTFRTAGLYTIPCRIKGIILSYQSNYLPLSSPYYDPSLKFTDKTSNIFSWRQNTEFINQLPELAIDVYNTSNSLLLSDTVNTSTNGIWEYSNDEGLTWSPWSYSANSVGNYIRFSASTLSAPGQIVKPILYPATPTPTPTPTISITPTITPTNTPTVTPTPNFDPDAFTFITAATISNTTERNAINQLVVDLKSFGLWSIIPAIYPIVGNSAFSQKFNLKDPRDLDVAFRLTFAGGWTHNVLGAQPNGSNGYAIPYITFSSFNPNNYSLGFYSNLSGNTGYIFGAADNTFSDYFGITINSTTSIRTFFGVTTNSVTRTSSSTNSLGFWAMNSVGTDKRMLCSDGTFETITLNRTFNWVNSGNIGIGVLASQQAPILQNYYNGRLSFAYISRSSGLTNTQLLNLRTIVTNFQTTLGRAVGPQVVSDSDAQAFINATNIQFQAEAQAVNQLVIDLKLYNIWDKMKVIYPLVGNFASTQKFNLKNPLDLNSAFRLSFISTIHSQTGLKGNGTNAYADTFFSPYYLTANNNHISWYSRTSTARSFATAVDLGVNDGTASVNSLLGVGRRIGDIAIFNSSDNLNQGNISVTNTDGSGFYVGSVLSNNDRKLYRNASVIGSLTSTINQTLSYNSIYLLGLNISGAASSYSDAELSFVSIGDGLTPTEVANLNTAVQAFQATLGR
jgi:hypothetical protein